MDSYEEDHSNRRKRPCRTCTDFQSWMKNAPNKKSESSVTSSGEAVTQCPVDSVELGRSSWALLHTITTQYPDHPSTSQQQEMRRFINLFAKLYPCSYCAEDFQQDILENPVQLESGAALSRWMCERHNTVNRKMHKPVFNCDLVYQRWRDGWTDGSCG